jgi:hypothetical protein
VLKPQDIVILLKILSKMTLSKSYPYEELTQIELARLLCMSASEVSAGIKRLFLSGLLGPVQRSNKLIFKPIKAAVEECLVSGVKYFLPVQLGEYTRGIVTSYAAPIFENLIVLGDDPVPVWPYGEGNQRGLALEPLYRSVPQSISKHPDQLFYELLVLIDAIRTGRARERNIAIKILRKKIHDNK